MLSTESGLAVKVGSISHQLAKPQRRAVLPLHSGRKKGDEVGNPYPNVWQIADAWVRAFADIEGGQQVTPETVANATLQENVQAVTTRASGPLSVVFPGTQIEEALMITQIGFAHGPDGVSVDLLFFACPWTFIQLSIFFVKTTLDIAAIIRYRMGSLSSSCTKEMDHFDTKMYRSIL